MRLISLAKRLHVSEHYRFITGNANTFIYDKYVDVILFSHMTHHLTDSELRALLRRLATFRFKHIVIYDGRPRGPLKDILTRLDFGAATFRNVNEFVPLIGTQYVIEHMETFRSNRPFYEYQLLILSKRK